MRKTKSIVVSFTLALLLTTCMFCDRIVTNAQANVLSTTTVWTSGGNGGKVRIKSDIYRNRTQIVSGAYRYDFGVNSFILESSSLKTNFIVSGRYYTSQNSAGTPFSTSAYSTRVNNQKSGSTSSSYYSMYTTTTTSSTAFGSSTQTCNATF